MSKTATPKLLLTTSPFLKQQEDTSHIMWQVTYSLLPIVLAAVYYFGLNAVMVISVTAAGAVLSEWMISRRQPEKAGAIHDGSALTTGLLLALTLPPGISLWMAFFGGVVAVLLGKMLFGGIGYNMFNPALIGRAFLQAAFPVAMTTWVPQSGLRDFSLLRGTPFALPFSQAEAADAITAATPLAEMKFEAKATALAHLLFGNTAGSLGETCALLILLGGAYLGLRKVLNWRIPVSIFTAVFLFAAVLYLINPGKYPEPLFYLLSGGLMLGAVFMATDPVTSPITPLGCWLFGMGIGVVVMVIRVFGGLPEGMMYAILLMNAATPLINRVTQPRVYGASRKK